MAEVVELRPKPTHEVTFWMNENRSFVLTIHENEIEEIMNMEYHEAYRCKTATKYSKIYQNHIEVIEIIPISEKKAELEKPRVATRWQIFKLWLNPKRQGAL